MTYSLTEMQQRRFADALKRIDGDAELLVTMAEIVSEDSVEVIAELDQAVSEVDPENVDRRLQQAADAGHSLKGMLSTFETGFPVDTLQRFITAAREGDRQVAIETWIQCREPIQALTVEISQLVRPA